MYSKLLNDELFEGIPDSQYENIQYHVNTYYPRYVRSKEELEKKTEIVPQTPQLVMSHQDAAVPALK